MAHTIAQVYPAPQDIQFDAQVSVDTASSSLLRRFNFWRERSRQRAALAELDAHQLADIGVTRAQARNEAAKPFWK